MLVFTPKLYSCLLVDLYVDTSRYHVLLASASAHEAGC